MARKFFTDLDLQSVSKVINVPTPSAAGDAVPKSYVDSAVEGLAWKDSARVSTQGNINLASPGATIDGITMASQDRVLVRSQTAPAENGIYVWNGAATTMTRSLDASTFAELSRPSSALRKAPILTAASVKPRSTAPSIPVPSHGAHSAPAHPAHRRALLASLSWPPRAK
jgi:hypothetical protein